MNLSIGEKIKKLRKENDVTQEKLADYLNISYQAVSKWENGTTLPDISMIIPLANFFGVPINDLFDMDTQKQNEELKKIEKAYRYLYNKGLIDEQIMLMREAVVKYPKNYSFLASLAFSLKEEESSDEKIAICERILEDCTDNGIRSWVIQILTFTYRNLQNWDKAKEYANKADSIYVCRELLLCNATTGEEYTENNQSLILSLLDILHRRLVSAAIDDTDDKILVYETALKMWQMFFYDGNYLFYHVRLFEIHSFLANSYAKKLNKTKAIDHLAAAKKHGKLFENMPEGEHHYTTIFANTCIHNKDKTSKTTTDTCIDIFYKEIQQECFDFIRDDPEFIALTQPIV